jgi:hypothetical protein
MTRREYCLITTILLSGCTYTSGTNVSADQAKQFVVGQSTVSDVEAKLGAPSNSQTNSDGTQTLLYRYDYTHQDATNYVPFYGMVHQQVEQKENKTTFVFSPSGVLQSYSAGTGGDTMSN